ncbi:MAG: Kae1-associated serine/threonine protein kinase [Thaumarchaeota archaeon]|nr:Kae1-associated serine/threonine protein kinase [Nitrososphaerota archaeon]
MMLIKKGAEADIYLVMWYGKKAVMKIRKPKNYRNKILDEEIRKKRTLHEAVMLSNAKKVGIQTPLLYFVDLQNTEIIMQYLEGKLVRDTLSRNLYICKKIGIYAATLHKNNIVHGDLTTSNFIINDGNLILIDFGLAYYSDRTEDKAIDIRLIKEIMRSVHTTIFNKAFNNFIKGYESTTGSSMTSKIMKKVTEIERRGRYARVV